MVVAVVVCVYCVFHHIPESNPIHIMHSQIGILYYVCRSLSIWKYKYTDYL